jgi:predicted Zn-dependent protease
MGAIMPDDCHARTCPEAHPPSHGLPRLTRRAFLLGGAGLVMGGCATAPVTGRRQLMLVSEAQEQAMGAEAYHQVLQQEPITHDPRLTEPVQRVARRLEAVTGHPEFQWEVNVIKEDQTANAFALPGGKVAVYTGIFPLAHTEAGLAIILGHELGHVIARHGAERVSQELLAQLGETTLAAAVQSSPYANSILAAYGLGAQVGVLLPYSRTQESEADRLGLVLAARAGYDPRVAVGVWERMAQLPGRRPPEFLSTHPAPESRIEEIKQFLPQALAEYRPQADAGDRPLPKDP